MAASAVLHWVEVPEGTPVFEYDMLPVAERAEELQLSPDLVIEERPGDTRYAFGEAAPTLAVDDEGRVFAYDASNYRVAVFGADGDFLYQFGGHGGGPGEFTYDDRGPIGFLGDTLCVFTGYWRVSFWTPEGEFLGVREHRLRDAGLFVPQADGTVLASTFALTPAGVVRGGKGWTHPTYLLVRLAPTELGLEPEFEYAAVPPWLRPTFAGTPSGQAYVATVSGHETQIVALSRDASVRWVTRLRQPPGTPTMRPDILLDENGRVFVMPRINRIEAPRPGLRRTVDVLDADGTHRAALTVPVGKLNVMWQVARGEHIYGVWADPDTYEWQLVRFRIVLP